MQGQVCLFDFDSVDVGPCALKQTLCGRSRNQVGSCWPEQMLMNLHKDRHNELVQIHTELAEVIHSIRSRVHEHGEHLRVLSSVAGPVTREDTIATI